MAARWFCSRDSMEIGPFAWQQVTQMAASGLIRPEDLLRTDVDPTWRPARECEGLFVAPAKKPAAAASTGKVHKAKIIAEPTAPPAAPPVQRATATTPVAPVTPKVKSVQVPGTPPVGKAVVAAPAIPQASAIPAGKLAIPTGSALPSGAAIPTGSAIPPSNPPGIPTGIPAAGIPTGVVARAPAAAASGDATATRGKPKKKDGSLLLLLGGGGLAVVLVIVFVLVMMNMNKPKAEVAQTTTPTSAAAKSNAAISNEKPVPPANAEVEASAALPDTVKSEAKAAAPRAASAPRDPIVLAVKKWNDGAAGKVMLKAAGVEVEVEKLWFASDESGREIESSTDATPSENPKFVCVQLGIACSVGNPPLAYNGWSKGAVLVDETGNTIAPLETSATPSLRRIGKTSINPGNSSEDVLVFPVADTSMKLKLALPHKNLGIKSAGVFGFDLARMNEKGMPILAETPVKKNGADMSAEATGEGEDAMPGKTAKKPKAEVDEVDDLVKRMEMEAKKADLAEAARKKQLEEAEMKKNAPPDAK